MSKSRVTSIPENTELLTGRLTHLRLRELYAGASFEAYSLEAYLEAYAEGIVNFIDEISANAARR